METDPVSETLFSSYLEFRTMDKVQEPSDSDVYSSSYKYELAREHRTKCDSLICGNISRTVTILRGEGSVY
jgi:hypothetical protein